MRDDDSMEGYKWTPNKLQDTLNKCEDICKNAIRFAGCYDTRTEQALSWVEECFDRIRREIQHG
jgi:hypothetical protein